jgi:phosphoribosylaminoimidazolecarboxamide formyltransferase/IMP cyclohydrolase
MERALFSLFNKKGEEWTDAVHIAKALQDGGCEILASGGTAKALLAEKVPVTDLDAFFARNAPAGQASLPSNLFGGFIRTISPQVFGGVFAQRGNAEHDAHLRLVGSQHIDVLVYDFYPHDHVAVGVEDPIEALFQGTDIGGPAVIEAGIKAGCWTVLPDSFSDFLRVLNSPRRIDALAANRAFRAAAKSDVAAYQEKRSALIQSQYDEDDPL